MDASQPGRPPRCLRHLLHHEGRPRILHRRIRLPLPLGQVRSDLRSRVQPRRDGEPGAGDLHGLPDLPRQGHGCELRVTCERHPPREGAHVVRRSGDEEVVGRIVAQGVLRRLHGRAGPGRAAPVTNGWVTFALRRKAWAYTQDLYPTTHPIVADIPDVEAAKLNFDGITYAKGASVLKQLVSFVGREAFFAGSRLYFKRFEYRNTELADFLDCLAEAAPDRDIAHWAGAWLGTSGVSELSLELTTS